MNTPDIATCLVSLSLLTLVHALSGTPEVLATIGRRLMVAISYAAHYDWKAGRR